MTVNLNNISFIQQIWILFALFNIAWEMFWFLNYSYFEYFVNMWVDAPHNFILKSMDNKDNSLVLFLYSYSKCIE